MIDGIGVFRHTPAPSASVPDFLRAENTRAARRFHRSLPGYGITPLVSLAALSEKLGVASILVKDESRRFGLNAFKGLGGSYAIFMMLCERLGLDPATSTFADLQTPERKKQLEDEVFITATDGNHGKGVSWASGLLGCRSAVYMPKGSSEARAQAIRDAGRCEVTITDLGYDDTVRLAARLAAENSWALIQDTSWDGYETIPSWIVQGYTTLAAEAADQMDEMGLAPTHVFLQAGVGAMAGGVLGCLADRYGSARPLFSIVEPDAVACVYASAVAGDGLPHAVVESGPTIMAGLNCGEPCTVTWPVLRDFAEYYFSCPDFVAAEGMRQLANPLGGDDAIVSGESGAATFGMLLQLLTRDAFRETRMRMGLDEKAVILLVSTEGDTDPGCYREVVEGGAYPAPPTGTYS